MMNGDSYLQMGYSTFLDEEDALTMTKEEIDAEFYGKPAYLDIIENGVSTCDGYAILTSALASEAFRDKDVHIVGLQDIKHTFFLVGDINDNESIILDPWAISPLSHHKEDNILINNSQPLNVLFTWHKESPANLTGEIKKPAEKNSFIKEKIVVMILKN